MPPPPLPRSEPPSSPLSPHLHGAEPFVLSICMVCNHHRHLLAVSGVGATYFHDHRCLGWVHFGLSGRNYIRHLHCLFHVPCTTCWHLLQTVQWLARVLETPPHRIYGLRTLTDRGERPRGGVKRGGGGAVGVWRGELVVGELVVVCGEVAERPTQLPDPHVCVPVSHSSIRAHTAPTQHSPPSSEIIMSVTPLALVHEATPPEPYTHHSESPVANTPSVFGKLEAQKAPSQSEPRPLCRNSPFMPAWSF